MGDSRKRLSALARYARNAIDERKSASINNPPREVAKAADLAAVIERQSTPNARTGTIDVPYAGTKMTPSQLDEIRATEDVRPLRVMDAQRTPWTDLPEGVSLLDPILLPKVTLTPEYLRPGKDALINLSADRTSVGALHGFAGNKFDLPFAMPGGYNYGRTMGNELFASALNPVSSMHDLAFDLSSRGIKPHGISMFYGPTGSDGSWQTVEPALANYRFLRNTGKIDDGVAEAFGRKLRSIKKDGEYPHADFPGMDSPMLREWLGGNFGRRADMIEAMGAKSFQEAGFPNINAIRRAVQEEELRGLPRDVAQIDDSGRMMYEGFGGHLIGSIDPLEQRIGGIDEKGKPFRRKDAQEQLIPGSKTWLPNETYPVQLRGQYEGGFDEPLPRSILFRDYIKGRREAGADPSGDYRPMQLTPHHQIVDQQLVDEASQYLEDARRLGISDMLRSNFADGGAVQRFDEGGLKRQKSKFAAAANVAKGALGAFRDAPTKKIEDWKWRPLADVPEAQRMAGEPLPAHIHPFGDFMVEQAERADMKGLTPRDLLKAYGITTSSIQRGALNRSKVEATGLPLSSKDAKIRPEGAFADWLMTPMGQRYLDAASRGVVDANAIADMQAKLKPFGLHEKLGEQLAWGARNLPSASGTMSDLVARAYHGKSSPQEWREMMRGVSGIGPAKSGFMSSMLGRGDNPTLDARQLEMHTPEDRQDKYMTRSSKKLPMTGGDEAVERLAARQRALGLDMPSRFDPMYQHLTHHGMWDASSGTQTTHQDIIDAMRYESGGKVEKDSERFKREANERIAADRAQYDRDIARRRERGGSAPRRFIDQAAKSARTQWSSLDSEGNPVAFWKAGDAPGMMYDVASMPADLTEIFDADIGGNAAGDYSKGASKHMENLRAAIGKEMEVAPARGAIEHAGSSFGNMIGQIPLLPLLPLRAGKQAIDAGMAAAGPLKRAAKTAFEFISPTLTPKFSRNIAAGTGIGTGIGYGIEALMGNGEEAQVGYNEGGGVKSKIAPLVSLARGAVRRIGEGTGYKSVPGKPATVEIPTIGRVETLPIPQLEDAAASYMRSIGRPGEHVITEYPEFDEDLARRLARAYDEMKNDPADPRVQRSYQALADETMAQLEKIKDSGLDIRFLKEGMDDPYAKSPALGYADIIENNRLYTFPTDFGFGTTDANAELLSQFKHPMLTKIGRLGDKDNAVVNDAFRVVHDAFGHFGPGNPFFRHKGEERAWLNHAPMYSPEARPAAAVELRGQNSYLNFGPHAEHNATASGADTVYADQKLGLMPEWTWTEKSKKKAVQKAEGGSVTGSGMNMDNKIERAPLPKPETPTFDGMSFEKAFAAARRANAPRFMWRGKPYTTELKRESAGDIERRAQRRYENMMPPGGYDAQREAAVREAEMPSRLYQSQMAQQPIPTVPAFDNSLVMQSPMFRNTGALGQYAARN